MRREKSRFLGTCPACGRPTARAGDLRWHVGIGAFVHAGCEDAPVTPTFLAKRKLFAGLDRKRWCAVARRVWELACADARARGVAVIGASRAWAPAILGDEVPERAKWLVCSSAATTERVACAVAEAASVSSPVSSPVTQSTRSTEGK